jgi:hypothetical protein
VVSASWEYRPMVNEVRRGGHLPRSVLGLLNRRERPPWYVRWGTSLHCLLEDSYPAELRKNSAGLDVLPLGPASIRSDHHKINQGHGSPPSLPTGTRLARLLRQLICHCESARVDEIANDICPFGDIFAFSCGWLLGFVTILLLEPAIVVLA